MFPTETKQALQMKVTRNRSTQNAEVLLFLEEAHRNACPPWAEMLSHARDEVGGVDLELPHHKPVRDFGLGD